MLLAVVPREVEDVEQLVPLARALEIVLVARAAQVRAELWRERYLRERREVFRLEDGVLDALELLGRPRPAVLKARRILRSAARRPW